MSSPEALKVVKFKIIMKVKIYKFLLCTGEQDEVVKALQNEIGMLGIHCKERVVLSEVILKSPYDRHAKQEFHSNSGVIRDTVKNINQLIEQLWTGSS